MAAAVAFAQAQGQDVNYDQLNYHYYTAYALLHWRLDLDAAPAQMVHSYFNPLANVPFYLLTRHTTPRFTSIVIAAVQAWGLVLAAVIAWPFCRAGKLPLLRLAAAVVLSAASPVAVSELGTSFTDTLTALPVLAAVALMLRSCGQQTGRLLLCGILAGGATGLKLTNAPFALALCCACLFYGPYPLVRLRAAFTAGLGAALGFAVFGGWWCVYLWIRFQSPLFPFYNSIFRSPDFPPTSDIDHSALPKGLWDALHYPFRWVVGIVPPNQDALVDIRFAVLFILLVLALLAGFSARLRHRPRGAADAPGLRLAAFWVAGFVLWIALFSIQRYMVVLELLCGPVALVLLDWVVGGWIAIGGGLAFAAAAAATFMVPVRDHIPFLPYQYGLRIPPDLHDDGLYFVTGNLASYVLPSLSPKARFFSIIEWEYNMASSNTVLTRRMQQAVAGAGRRHIHVIGVVPLTWQSRIRLGSYGLQPTGRCEAIPGHSRTHALFICDVVKSLDTRPAAMTLDPGARISFTPDALGFMTLTSLGEADWIWPGVEARLQPDTQPGLYFRRGPGFGQNGTALHVMYQAVDGGTPGAVNFTINGVPARGLRAETDRAGITTLSGCVPASVAAADSAVTATFHAPDTMHFQLLGFTVDAPPACP